MVAICGCKTCMVIITGLVEIHVSNHQPQNLWRKFILIFENLFEQKRFNRTKVRDLWTWAKLSWISMVFCHHFLSSTRKKSNLSFPNFESTVLERYWTDFNVFGCFVKIWIWVLFFYLRFIIQCQWLRFPEQVMTYCSHRNQPTSGHVNPTGYFRCCMCAFDIGWHSDKLSRVIRSYGLPPKAQ